MKTNSFFNKGITALFIILLSGFTTDGLCQQTKSETSYYVSAKETILYSDSSLSAKVLGQLKQHDNLILLQKATDWFKVRLAETKTEGFVRAKSVKRGKAVWESSRYRVGAVCKDGSRSSATGRGACSWHGGVSRWLYNTRSWAKIIK